MARMRGWSLCSQGVGARARQASPRRSADRGRSRRKCRASSRARPRRHALLAGLRQRGSRARREGEAVADMARSVAAEIRNGERHHRVASTLIGRMGAQRRLAVGRADRDGGAEHRLGDLDDAPLAVEQEPRNRPQLAALIAPAQHGEPPLRVGRRPGAASMTTRSTAIASRLKFSNSSRGAAAGSQPAAAPRRRRSALRPAARRASSAVPTGSGGSPRVRPPRSAPRSASSPGRSAYAR